MQLKKVKLSYLGEIVTGRTPPTKNEEYYGEKFPFITPTDINSSARFIDTERYLSNKGYDYQKKVLLPSNSICFVCIGATIGKICMTKKPSFTDQQINSIIPDTDNHDPGFIYYLLSTKGEAIKKIAGGAATPIVNKSSFSDFEIEVPKLEQQKKIASILSAFDDLIENNTRRIEILEEMARRIYREWFVHFRYPGHKEDELVDSGTKLVNIPEGWEVRKLLDICNMQTGKALKSKQFNEDGMGVKAVRIRNVRTNSSDTFTAEKFDDKYLVENGDILVGMDGDFHMCRWADGKSVLVQRVARFRPKKEVGLSRYFFFWAIKKPVDYFNYTITGTTVAHLGKKHIKTIEIVLPPKGIRNKINKILEPMYEEDILLRRQNKKLKETRDLLLPKLISGKVGVGNIERKLKAV